MFICCLSVVPSDAPTTIGPLWSSATRDATRVTLKSSSGVTKRRVSLKLSSAAKGPGIAVLIQKKKGHHLEDMQRYYKRVDPDDEADHRHWTSWLQPWRLDSVYCNCSCQLSLCLMLFSITQGNWQTIQRLEGLRGSCLCRDVEMKLYKTSVQGDVRESIELAFILQINVQLTLTMGFFFVFMPYFFVSWNFHTVISLWT